VLDQAHVIRSTFDPSLPIVLNAYGLSDKNCVADICVNAQGSSTFRFFKDKESMTIDLKDVFTVYEEKKRPKIDLLKLNVEGAEYEILPRMIETKVINHCNYVLVQFHNFIEGAEMKRNKICSLMAETHSVVFCFPFVWELWKLKK
jgi:FkbM family methyltransferase